MIFAASAVLTLLTEKVPASIIDPYSSSTHNLVSSSLPLVTFLI